MNINKLFNCLIGIAALVASFYVGCMWHIVHPVVSGLIGGFLAQFFIILQPQLFKVEWKLDANYYAMSICPTTKQEISCRVWSHSSGVCPYCGDDNVSSFTHREVIVGKWNRPNWFGWLCGKRKIFVKKEV